MLPAMANTRPRTSSSGGVNWKTVGIWGGGILAVGLLSAVVVTGLGSGERPEPPEGTEIIAVSDRTHTDADLTYEQDPPAGGAHNPVWLECGFYPFDVPEENAVHSLEHGVVWITYRPGISQDEIDTLADLAGNAETIVSQRSSQQPPIVASAWGARLELDSADDSRLDQFLDAFRDAPTSPEPLASCRGGIVPTA